MNLQAQRNPSPSRLARLRGRLRHGLLLREILDRLVAWDIVVQPYILTVEQAALLPTLAAPAGYHVRELHEADAEAIVAISLRERELQDTRDLLKTYRCHGIFHDAQLAGYTWSSFTDVPIPTAHRVLFDLKEDEGYLRDMFIAPAYRGARLAPWLRAQVLQALRAEGRPTCYSLTLVGNRSSRRFKARLGAREMQWRVYLHLLPARWPGVDLRLWTRETASRASWLLPVAPNRKSPRGR